MITEKYTDPQRLYTDMLCTIHGVPRYVSPVLAALIPYANKRNEVRINLATKRTLAYELGISLDAFTKSTRLAEKHELLEVINSLRYQLKPCLSDCKKISLSFTEDGVNIATAQDTEPTPVSNVDVTPNATEKPDLSEFLAACDAGYVDLEGDDDSGLPF